MGWLQTNPFKYMRVLNSPQFTRLFQINFNDFISNIIYLIEWQVSVNGDNDRK